MNSAKLAKKYAPHLIDNDSLSDSAHDRLDKAVVRHGFAYLGSWKVARGWIIPACVACQVVEFSPTLDVKYKIVENMRTQMKHQPELEKAFIDCWKIERFKTFRRFKSLQVPVLQMEAIRQAWEAPFIGNTHVLLHNMINKMNSTRVENAYGNILTIAQSPGAGKSRTVHELASLVFTLPFNLRESLSWHCQSNDKQAFPQPDIEVREFFGRLSQTDDEMPVLRCYAFFRSLFSEVTKRVTSLRNGLATADSSTFAVKWKNYLEQENGEIRSQMYSKIVASAKHQVMRYSHRGKGLYEYEKDAKRAASRLLDAIQSVDKALEPTDAHIVLYFDDVHTLNQPMDLVQRTRYDVLSSAFSLLVEFPLFCIMTSTEPDLALVGPSQTLNRYILPACPQRCGGIGEDPLRV